MEDEERYIYIYRERERERERERLQKMAKEQLKAEDEGGKQGPISVTLPVSASPQDYPSLKLTLEESDQDMSPRNMWQVYALGGFLVLRWIWARWRERKSRGELGGEPTNVG